MHSGSLRRTAIGPRDRPAGDPQSTARATAGGGRVTSYVADLFDSNGKLYDQSEKKVKKLKKMPRIWEWKYSEYTMKQHSEICGIFFNFDHF